MIRNSNIRNLATEQEYEDQGTDDWGFIQNVVAPPAPAHVAAPVSAPAPAPFNPVGFDWQKQGMQNIGGTIYQPSFESLQLGHGEEGGMYGQGELQNVLRYKEGQTAPGQAYEILDPATGKITGTGKFEEQSKGFFGDLWDMTSQAAADLGPILQYTPLGPAVAAINAVNAARTGDFFPAVASAAGFGGYTDIANAAKAADALRKENYLGAILPGLSAAGVSDVGGYTLKEIAPALSVARAIESENPLALLGAASKYLPTTTPDSQTAVGGGADTGDFFDSEEAQAVQDDIDSILTRYPEQQSFFPEFDQPLLTAESAPTPISAPERMAFLEANISEPETVQELMQEYYPELYQEPDQRIEVTGKREPVFFPEFEQPLLTAEPVDNEMQKLLRQQELAQAGESPLGGMGYNAKELPLINVSGAPSAVPTPGKPAAPTAPATPQQPGLDLASLFTAMGALGKLGAQQEAPKEVIFNAPAVNLDTLFGYKNPTSNEDLLTMIGQRPRG